jgi:hypothetical protein
LLFIWVFFIFVVFYFWFFLARDAVPNVRFNAVKVLFTISSRLSPELVKSKIKPVLDALVNDKDKDVRFFVTQGVGSS